MTDESTPVAGESEDGGKKKKKKKKNKVQCAWIAFAGRIVAQILGAVATVVLGVLVLHKYSGQENKRADRERIEAVETTVTAAARLDSCSLAVLPFDSYSANSEAGYFAEGLTDTLITRLSKVDRLKVVSRSSSMHVKKEQKPVRDIGRELGALWIVEGAIIQAGGRVRITVQLVDTEADADVWAETYERPASDVLGVQMEVANAVSQAITEHLGSAGLDSGTGRKFAATLE